MENVRELERSAGLKFIRWPETQLKMTAYVALCLGGLPPKGHPPPKKTNKQRKNHECWLYIELNVTDHGSE